MSTVIPNPRVYSPGQDVTAEATAAVTGGRFVKISGNRTAGGNIAVAPAGAAAVVFGVAATDAAIGGLVRVVRGGVVKVAAGADITAGTPVASDANGAAVPATAGAAGVVGFAVNGAANGKPAEIALTA